MGTERFAEWNGTEQNGMEGLDHLVENLPPGRFPGRKRLRFERPELSIPSFILIFRGGASRDDESAPRGPKSSFCFLLLFSKFFLGGGGGGGVGSAGGPGLGPKMGRAHV